MGKNTEPNNAFAEFWDIYPKKVAKKDARRAWAKLKPDSILLAKIFTAVVQQKKTEQWKNRQYIPNPASWLNGERWEDTIEVKPTAVSEKLAVPVCVVCKGDGKYYSNDRDRKPVWLCRNCRRAVGTRSWGWKAKSAWGYMTMAALEKAVEQGKVKLAKRSTPPEPDTNDKRNAAAKLVADTIENFGKG